MLSPPGIIGGYRNQFIRFISFLKYAQIHNIPNILLPSLLWSTTHRAANNEMNFFPIPMQSLFDIDYWNTFVVAVQDTNNYTLPLLVEFQSKEIVIVGYHLVMIQYHVQMSKEEY